MKRFILFLMMFLVVGCGMCRKIQYIPIQTSKDSIVVEKVIERVDTLKIEIPKEVEVYVGPVDSSHLETSVAVSDAVIDSTGLLHHSLVNKEGALKQEVIYKDRIVEVTVEKEVPVIQEVEKVVEVVPPYYRRVSTIFWCLVAGVILYFVIFILIKFKVFP